MRFSLYIIILLFPAMLQGQAELPRLERITPKDGLPNRWINQICQDSTGFIWLLSKGKVFKYDGLKFKDYSRYSTQEGRPKNDILSIVIDGQNHVWFDGKKSLIKFNTALDSIELEIEKTKFEKLEIIEGKRVYISIQDEGKGYLLYYDNNLQPDTVIAFPERFTKIENLVERDDTFLFIDQNKNLQILQKGTNQFTSNQQIGQYSLPNSALFLDGKNNLWHISQNVENESLAAIKIKDGLYRKLDISKHALSELGISGDSIIWFHAKKNKTLLGFNLHSERLLYKYQLPQDLSYYDLLHDKQNVIWLATDFGLLKFPLTDNQLFRKYISTVDKNQERISTRGIFIGPNKSIYISAYGNQLIELQLNKKSHKTFLVKDYAYNPIYDADRGGYWYGSEFYTYRFQALSLEGPIGQEKQVSKNGGRASIKIDKNTILIAGRKKVETFDISKQVLSNANDDIFKTRAVKVIKHKKDQYWVITKNELFLVDKFGTPIDQDHRTLNKLLTDVTLFDIHQSINNTLWLGSNEGLIRYDLKSKHVKIYQQSDGLPNNTINLISEDSNNRIWLGTNFGLACFTPDTEQFNNFYEEDGIADNEFNHSSSLKLDSLIIFGGINGITVIKPNNLEQKTEQKFPLLLTQFSRFNEKSARVENISSNLDQLKNISISPTNKYFKFEFNLLDYHKKEQQKYSWILEGFDKEWGEASRLNFVQYNNIPAGNYTFKVKALNANGYWTDDYLSIDVTVKQIFYKTWWFIVGCLSLLFAVAYYLYYIKISEKLRLAQLRTKIASDLHDEVGSVMTRIALGSDIIQSGLLNTEEQKAELDKIALQSRSATSTMSDVVWSIDARKETMGDLLDRMREHTEEMFAPTNIEYQFKTSNINNNLKLKLDLKQNLYFIYKEAINNIVKHSSADKVDILLKNTDGTFEMFIQNNGTLKSQTFKQGQGLSNMKMRAKNINGTIEIDTENGFSIRLSKKSF